MHPAGQAVPRGPMTWSSPCSPPPGFQYAQLLQGCTQQGLCVLSVGLSPVAWAFLTQHGVNGPDHVRDAASSHQGCLFCDGGHETVPWGRVTTLVPGDSAFPTPSNF